MSTRACDGCRIRKVKCDHGRPCGQCAHLDLPCTIVATVKRRANPVRGRLIARVRRNGSNDNTDNNTKPASWAPITTPHGSENTIRAKYVSLGEEAVADVAPFTAVASTQPLYPPSSPTSSNFTKDFFIQLLPDFEELVYPFNPIISLDDIQHSISNMESNVEDRALVFAFASTTIFLAQPSHMHLRGSVKTQMDNLMQRSLEAHRALDLQTTADGHMSEEPAVTMKRIVTCIFLEISMMAFSCYNRSFTLLREAITMLQISGVDRARCHLPDSRSSDPCTDQYQARYERLYWEAFIHERFLTIAAGYPSILQPLESRFPISDATVPAHVELGFSRLIQLFLVIDKQFLTNWCSLQQQQQLHTITDINDIISVEWVETKQSQLDADEASTLEADRQLRASGQGGMTELQHVDLFVTRLWLRTLVWQLALSRGLLRSVPPQDAHEGLSLHFPAQRLSTQLRLLVSRLDSVASIRTQGIGIVQKLFEITSTIADVLTLPLPHDLSPIGGSGNCGGQQNVDAETAHVADFIFLVQFTSQFDRIRDQQKDYLWDKVNMLRAKYGWQLDRAVQ